MYIYMFRNKITHMYPIYHTYISPTPVYIPHVTHMYHSYYTCVSQCHTFASLRIILLSMTHGTIIREPIDFELLVSTTLYYIHIYIYTHIHIYTQYTYIYIYIFVCLSTLSFHTRVSLMRISNITHLSCPRAYFDCPPQIQEHSPALFLSRIILMCLVCVFVCVCTCVCVHARVFLCGVRVRGIFLFCCCRV